MNDTPLIVQQAMQRMSDRLSKPPVPIMTQDEFDKLPKRDRAMLICNMPDCKNVVSTHGLLCVEHTGKL